jgi:hypothetical protein
MMRRCSWALAAAVLGSCLLGCALAACPPASFDSMADLDLSRFLAGPWYSQQQVSVWLEHTRAL